LPEALAHIVAAGRRDGEPPMKLMLSSRIVTMWADPATFVASSRLMITTIENCASQ
jgi:hypothetical protein